MMMAKRFGTIKDYKDWLEPKLVSNALELLDREIPKYISQIDFVHLCFTTDPFMYGYSDVEDLTLRIIKKLNESKIKTTVLTKGIYPRELTAQEIYHGNTYGITLVSLSEDFKRRFEPFSAPFEDRIEALKYLHEAGLETWASIEPYPTPNLIEQDFSEILNAVSFVDKIVFGKLNYNLKAGKSSTDFYERCASTLVTFCNENDINYHIKNGTRLKDDRTTTNVLGRGALGLSTKIC
jgi:DNA repair photolyase